MCVPPTSLLTRSSLFDCSLVALDPLCLLFPPTQAEACSNLGAIYSAQQKFAEAVKCFDEAYDLRRALMTDGEGASEGTTPLQLLLVLVLLLSLLLLLMLLWVLRVLLLFLLPLNVLLPVCGHSVPAPACAKPHTWSAISPLARALASLRMHAPIRLCTVLVLCFSK